MLILHCRRKHCSHAMAFTLSELRFSGLRAGDGSPAKVGGRFRITSQSHCILLQSSTLIYSLEFSSSRSFPTFHRVKSSKSARQRQNQSFVPSARELLCNIPRLSQICHFKPFCCLSGAADRTAYGNFKKR